MAGGRSVAKTTGYYLQRLRREDARDSGREDASLPQTALTVAKILEQFVPRPSN